MVVATTTLAVGVDFPADVVVIDGTRAGMTPITAVGVAQHVDFVDDHRFHLVDRFRLN